MKTFNSRSSHQMKERVIKKLMISAKKNVYLQGYELKPFTSITETAM